MAWVPLVFVVSLVAAAFFYALASLWVPYRPRRASPEASQSPTGAVPRLTKVAAFLAFWIGSVEALFASPLFADVSALGCAGAALMLVAGWAVIGRAPRAAAGLLLAVAVTMGAGFSRGQEFLARASAVMEYRSPEEKKNPCCGENPSPTCLSYTIPCPEGFMQVWRNAAAAWVYRVFSYTSIALGGVGMLSWFFAVSKPTSSEVRWDCRKCGKVVTLVERRCPKCGAIDCWKK